VTDAASLNLFEQQAKNRRQTVLWMIAFVLFLSWLGLGGDIVMGNLQNGAPVLTIIVLAIAALITWRSWKKGPQRILWSAGAREIESPQTTEERQFVNVVEEMAIAAGLPKPKAYIIEDDDPNAFATGHGPEDACVAATRGLINTLNREELQAVVGHEMGHVRNLDVRLMTTIAALAGLIVLVADGAGRFMRFGGLGGRSSSRSKGSGGGGGVLILVVLVIWVITLILAPLITRIMAMGVSRSREYLADATGAELTRNPGALASALEKIDAAVAPTKSITRGAAHLCIADPLGRKVNEREGAFANLMGTHPPIRMRIARLKGMSYQRMKAEGQLPAQG
jgi:heat shock protein HtpX